MLAGAALLLAGNVSAQITPTAGTANPFAYALSSSVTDGVVTVNYSLNADATAVAIVLSNSVKNEVVKTVDLEGDLLTKGAHSTTIDLAGLPDACYTWVVKVTGAEKTTVEQFQDLAFWHPAGIAVDNSMESPSFGTLFIADGYTTTTAGKTRDDGAAYVGGNDGGSGLYIYDAAGNAILNKDGGQRFYGTKFAQNSILGVNASGANVTGGNFVRVGISDDGRIYVARNNNSGDYILYAENLAKLQETGEFTSLLEGKTMDATTCAYTDESGNFLVGPVQGFSVKGAGENIKLLALTRTSNDVVTFVYSLNRTAEYAIGTATTLPSPSFIAGLDQKYTISYDRSANMKYDSKGGIWYIQHRGAVSDTQPSLVYINANGEEKYKDITTANRRRGAIAVHPTMDRIAAMSASGVTSIYDITTAEDGTITLTEVYTITTGGGNMYDLAWDAAGNLYGANASTEYVRGYAIPRTEPFETKAAAQYAICYTAPIAPLYAVGAGDILGNWAPATPAEFTYADGKYTLVLDETATEFKISTAMGDWNAFNAGNLTPDAAITNGGTVNLTVNAAGGNIALPWAGEWTIVVDLKAMTLTASTETPEPQPEPEPDPELVPTLTKVFEITADVPARAWNGGTRYCAGWNGKVLLPNTVDKAISAWDATNGKVTVVDLSAEGIGNAIATDDAGNILVNNAFNNLTSRAEVTNWTIISADYTTKKSIVVTLPEGVTAARMDQIGHVAGNMLSEDGAYVFLAIDKATKVVAVKIAKGEFVSATATKADFAALNTSAVAQPLFKTAAEIEAAGIDKSFYLRYRADYGLISYVNDENALAKLEYPVKGTVNQEGFALFTLKGETYIAHPIANGDDTQACAFAVENLTTKTTAASYVSETDANATDAHVMGIAAQAISDTEAYIYVFYHDALIGCHLFSLEAPAEEKDPVYIVGYNGTWDPAAPLEIPYVDGVYKLENVTFTNSEFKLSTAKGDWNAFDAGVICAANDAIVEINTPTALYVGGNANIKIATTGTYDVEIDLENNTITLIGEVVYPETVYMIGNLGEGFNWNTNDDSHFLTPVEGSNGVYEIKDVNLVPTGGSTEAFFSFTTAIGADWPDVNAAPRYGAVEEGATPVLGEAIAVASEGGATKSWKLAAGTYNMVLDLANMTLTVTEKTSGIEGIEAENAPAVYYNLQGVEVENPENGVYIRVQGGKASKVLVK